MTDSTDKLHHLTHDAKTGRWEMRVTVDEGEVVVGRPIRIKLGKCTEARAIRLRDQHLRTLRAAGVRLKFRMQRRPTRSNFNNEPTTYDERSKTEP